MNYLDLHADTLTMLKKGDLYSNDNDISLSQTERCFSSYVQTFAIWTDPAKPTSDQHAYDLYQRMVDLVQAQSDRAALCTNRTELSQTIQAGKAAILFSVEDLAAVASYAEDLPTMGFTSVMLTWNEANQYATGAVTDQSAGLTVLGRKIVRKLDSQGIIFDVSHLSDAGFDELCTLTDRPVIASHSNCRSICNHPRNLTDTEIREIIHRHGLIGMNVYPPFVQSDETVTLSHLVAHMEHILSFGGEDVLSLGCDLDGCNGQFPEGFYGVSSIPKLYNVLLRRNYSESLVRKIFFDNGLSFLTQELPH